ncbi:MAG: phosphonate ABC transporter, permease protein PhnE [Betaproteobacteria bacterium]|nr:phosphonate ABC transporter, permease protein PhnE [Betaproteobacteria bacterium]
MNTLAAPSPNALARIASRAAAERHGWLYYAAWALAIGVLAWAWRGAEVRPLDLLRDSANIGTYAKEFFPPDFTDWRIYAREMLITVHIAIWGTLLAVIAAVPMGLASSANIARPWVYQPARRIMDACRAINEMVFAMLFIVAVGLGPFAGVLALAVHTTGTLAKLFSEAVEAIDPRPVEGIRAAGSHKLVEIVYGVLPQVMPLWLSFTLYRFESNVRSASVVGMVGAGGIGVVLFEVIRGFQYAQTCAVLIILVLCVSVIDLFSAWLRNRFI